MTPGVQADAIRHPYFLLAVLSVAASLFFAWVAWNRRQSRRPATYFVAFMTAQAAWAFTAALRILLATEPAQIFALQLWGTAAQLTGVLWMLFVLSYVDRLEYASSLPFKAAVALSAVVVAAYWTNPVLHLLWTDITRVQVAGLTAFKTVDTPLVAVEFAVLFAYALGGLALLFRHANAGTTRVHRRQSLLLSAAGLILLATGTLSILNAQPHAPLPVTASSFAVSAAFIFWAVYGYRFLDILPLARRKVVASMDQAVLVLDDTDTVVDANQAAASLFPQDDGLPGTHVSTLLPDHPELYRDVDPHSRHRTELTLQRDTERRYQVNHSPLFDDDRFIGRVLVFDDITPEWQRKRELERQNERLERFASTLSHDLRNPLSIADGYLSLARETGDLHHLDTVQEEHERMDDLIDDVLTLAREGQAVTSESSVDAGDTARDAGAFLDGTDATLRVDLDATIRADESRLARVFENLYRNAIEHAGSDATIHVDSLPTGFSVEDDGPGIPEDARSDVFEYGVTHSEDGTGLGLAIVKNVVEAHGWTITVTDGETLGGARFEITNVEPAD